MKKISIVLLMIFSFLVVTPCVDAVEPTSWGARAFLAVGTYTPLVYLGVVSAGNGYIAHSNRPTKIVTPAKTLSAMAAVTLLGSYAKVSPFASKWLLASSIGFNAAALCVNILDREKYSAGRNLERSIVNNDKAWFEECMERKSEYPCDENKIRNIDHTDKYNGTKSFFIYGIKDSKDDSLLHYAVKYQRDDMFEFILLNTINIKHVNNDGLTPLDFAVDLNNIECARKLLEREKFLANEYAWHRINYFDDKKYLDTNGMTTLERASACKKDAMVDLLLEFDFDEAEIDYKRRVEARYQFHYQDGFTRPFIRAFDHKDLGLVTKLVEKYKNPQSRYRFTAQFATVLPYIVAHLDQQDFDVKQEEILEYIIGQQSVNVIDRDGLSALWYAVNNKNVKMVQFLVNRGANIQFVDRDGYNLLYNVLGYYPDRYQQRNDWHRPLEKENKYAIAHLLINQGVDVNFEVAAGGRIGSRPLLHRAIVDENDADIDFLLAHGARPHFIFKIDYHNRLQELKILLDHHVNISTQDSDGNTLLHIAIAKNYFSIAEMLLKHDPNRSVPNHAGQFPDDLIPASSDGDDGFLRAQTAYTASAEVEAMRKLLEDYSQTALLK